jgi:hypothetical protein
MRNGTMSNAAANAAAAVGECPFPEYASISRGDVFMATKVAKAFEEKVVDEENIKAWHPLWLWDADARKKEKIWVQGYEQFHLRLNAYCRQT